MIRQKNKKNRGRNYGRSEENQDTVLSRALSWVLRHGAPSLGLEMSTAGYIPIASILTCSVRNLYRYKEEDVKRVVATNDKQRFSLCILPIITTEDYKTYSFVTPTDQNDKIGAVKALCIRANQGHSTKGVVAEDLLVPIPPEELENLLIVHGTNKKAWKEHICNEGLSRMRRNHIHFAPGLPDSSSHVVSGMRKNCEIHIFIDGAKCARDDVKFYQSTNGVILTPGASNDGILAVNYFKSVIDVEKNENILKQKGNVEKLPVSMAAIDTNNKRSTSSRTRQVNSNSIPRKEIQSQGNKSMETMGRLEEKEKLMDEIDPIKRAKKVEKTSTQIAESKKKDPVIPNEDQVKKISREEASIKRLDEKEKLTDEIDPIKRAKKVKKTLKQIAELKKKDPVELNEDQVKKISREEALIKESKELEVLDL